MNSTKKILLIEDESMIREMYEMILSKKGYQVDSAEDGQQGITKLLQNPQDYNLILLDIMLPKLDGISVLKKIKQSDSPIKDIPVFLLTNLGQENLIKEAMSLGAVQYWIKSNIFPVDLVKEIDAFLTEPEDNLSSLNHPTTDTGE
jgi:DNA-binding response OmpR family regulator